MLWMLATGQQEQRFLAQRARDEGQVCGLLTQLASQVETRHPFVLDRQVDAPGQEHA